MTYTPDPAIVAALYNLDLDPLFEAIQAGENWNDQAATMRRLDGTPASPDEVEAVKKSRFGDIRAVVDMQRHALEQSRYKLELRERINELLRKYAHSDDEQLGVIEQRMTLADWVRHRRLWDKLGNVMELHGDD